MSNKIMDYIKETSTNVKQGTKDALIRMHEIVITSEDCLSLLQNAYIYNTSKFVNECNMKIKYVKKEGAHVAIEISGMDDPYVKSFLPVPDHLLKIVENIEKLSENIDKKIRDNILFSDRAVKETVFLLQRLIEILSPTGDIILARNTFLSMYIEESQEGVGKMTRDYATFHEERLIKGVCLPVSSSLYVNMLNEINNIAWHAKEISLRLAGL